MKRGKTRTLTDDELVNLNARVPRGLIRRVRAYCAAADMTMREFITSALDQHLAARRRRR